MNNNLQVVVDPGSIRGLNAVSSPSVTISCEHVNFVSLG